MGPCLTSNLRDVQSLGLQKDVSFRSFGRLLILYWFLLLVLVVTDRMNKGKSLEVTLARRENLLLLHTKPVFIGSRPIFQHFK